MQIWKNDQKGDDKIIAFFNQTIYKANPNSTEVEGYISELKINSIPSAKALEIPLSYLKEITMEEGKNYIDLHFGSDSNEHFVITDDTKRMEIFDHLKTHLPVENTIVKNSKIRSARKPLIAMVVITLIFLWTLFVAMEVESGTDYEVAGSYRSVAGIVLALAYLGVKKVVLIFGLLLTIAIVAFLKKNKKCANNPSASSETITFPTRSLLLKRFRPCLHAGLCEQAVGHWALAEICFHSISLRHAGSKRHTLL